MKWLSLLMCHYVLRLVKCLSMSFDELQDFSNFLKDTSKLDQPLKRYPGDESDENDIISDHAWEESGRFEGDLILNERQRAVIVQKVAEGLSSRNGIQDSTKRWPNNEVIYYIQREHFSADQVQAIMDGIDDLSRASCIKFRPYVKGDRDAVVVQGSRRGCFSQVGYQGGYQVLNLSGRHPVGRGCFRHGTVVHEFLHTLGFYHMQSSPDRDDYIDVLWDNIARQARHNFRKYDSFSVSDFGVGYDYDSVLHYSRKAFSINGGDTLVPKQNGAEIGQRAGLSDKDTAKLNKMYCDADSNNNNDETSTGATLAHKPANKKKPKNKPFQGHGIGYHQGKTVVIKLPAAGTYQLPVMPSYRVFDDFSEAPQALSSTPFKGSGIGEKITYTYKIPAAFHKVDNQNPIIHKIPSVISKNSVDSKIDHEITRSVTEKPSVEDFGNDKTEETIEDSKEKSPEREKPKSVPHQTNEGFARLDEIIKSRKYPDWYKANTDYSEFYNLNNLKPKKSITDYYLNYSPPKVTNYLPAVSNLKLTREFIENLHDSKNKKLYQDEKNIDNDKLSKHEIKRDTEKELQSGEEHEKDISYGKTYPKKKLENIKSIYSLKPDYTFRKYLEGKEDFSAYYNPDSNSRTEKKRGQYKLFGEPVPFSGKLYRGNDESSDKNKKNGHLLLDDAFDSYESREKKLENIKLPKSEGYELGSGFVEGKNGKYKWFKDDVGTPETSSDNNQNDESKERNGVDIEPFKPESNDSESGSDEDKNDDNKWAKKNDRLIEPFTNNKQKNDETSLENSSDSYESKEKIHIKPLKSEASESESGSKEDQKDEYKSSETIPSNQNKKQYDISSESNSDSHESIQVKSGNLKLTKPEGYSDSQSQEDDKEEYNASQTEENQADKQNGEPNSNNKSNELNIDDKLSKILNGYENIDDYDIKSPYRSSEESEDSKETVD